MIIAALLCLCDATALMAGGTTAATGGGSVTTGNTYTGQDGTKPEVEQAGLSTDVTRQESPDLLEDTLDSVIVKVRPTKTPLVSILALSKANQKKTNNMLFAYYSLGVRDRVTEITAEVTGNSTSVATIKVENARLFDESDTIRIVDGDKEYSCYVESSDESTGELRVQMIYDQESEQEPAFPAIANGATVYRCSRAAAEGDMQTVQYTALPSKERNYCQIFKMQVGETTLQRLADKEVPFTLNDVEEQAIYEMKRDMEASYLFNQTKGYFHNLKKKKYIYTTAVIVPEILKKGKNLSLSLTPTNEELIDLSKDIFTGNNGSEKRLVFCGSEAMARLSKIGLVQKQMEAGNTEIVFGVTFNKIVTNFGELYVMQHDALDENGYENKLIVLDPQFIDEYTLLPTSKESLDLKKAGVFDGDVSVTTKISGIAVKNHACHAIVSFK
jgi:hypothetical protein